MNWTGWIGWIGFVHLVGVLRVPHDIQSNLLHLPTLRSLALGLMTFHTLLICYEYPEMALALPSLRGKHFNYPV